MPMPRVLSKGALVQEAMLWIKDHPEAWEYMKDWVLAKIKNEEHFTTTELSYAVKASGLVTNKYGERVSFKNPLRAPITRFLIREIPKAEPFVKLQKSKTDYFFSDIKDMKKKRIKEGMGRGMKKEKEP
jgi:hypothetical protein